MSDGELSPGGAGELPREGSAELPREGSGELPREGSGELPREGASVGWLTGSGRWRRLGSALHWAGDRVAVLGADPDGAITAMAAEVPGEPDVVTVIGELDGRDDWSTVEAVLPIAAPPGSRGRLAVAGAGASDLGLAARLARELTATVIAPRGDVLLVPGGSLFAVDGWLRYEASGASAPDGRRTPRPEWEADIDGLCVPGGPDARGGTVLRPIPAGMWLCPEVPGAPPPELDDPAYGVPLDAERPVLLVGRPDDPEVSEEAILAVVRALPSSLRHRLRLAPYGPAASTVAAAVSLARDEEHPVLVCTGVPALADDGQLVSVAVDGSGTRRWESLPTSLIFRSTGPAEPTGTGRALDGFPRVDEHVFRLNEQWVAEVTQSGLWVRPPLLDGGAEVVRGHPWVPSKLRIFVGVPGEPPGHEVLPLLGALVGRLPVETRRRVELAPEPFAVAATVSVTADDEPQLDAGARDEPDSDFQRAMPLRGLPPRGAGGEATATIRPAASKAPPRPAASKAPPRPAASKVRRRPAARPAAAPPGPESAMATTPAPRAAALSRMVPVPVPPPFAAPAATRRADPPDESTAELPLVATDLPASPDDDPRDGARPDRAPLDGSGPYGPALPPRSAPAAGPPPAAPHRIRVRRLPTPVLAAISVLVVLAAVATVTGYALNQTSGRRTAAGSAVSGTAAPPSEAPPPWPLPTPDNGSPPAAGASVPAAGGQPSGTAGPGAAGPPVVPGQAPGQGGRLTAPVGPQQAPPTAPTGPQQAPPPATRSVMPGLVNSSGRNLALGGTATASSVEPPGTFAVAYANDGDPDTRWSSAFESDPQWLAVDLGAVWQVTQVRVLWERAYATAYRVEVSLDGRAWRTVYATSRGAGGAATIAVTRTPARYVRMLGTARAADGYGYSLHEFEVR
ncbi:discoidin domain-containing protein [Plantactinospora sp. WMMB334]|uniref:discoidin domain-containing protein n=1 Tax=Plantactinospora sp. WMMB334 TaxID=3404119 RepID=UPI003B95A052